MVFSVPVGNLIQDTVARRPARALPDCWLIRNSLQEDIQSTFEGLEGDGLVPIADSSERAWKAPEEPYSPCENTALLQTTNRSGTSIGRDTWKNPSISVYEFNVNSRVWYHTSKNFPYIHDDVPLPFPLQA